MNFSEVTSLLENHTTAKLIRANNAALIISFLFKAFKTENKKNFLTLPQLKNTIALWSGGGFSVSYLKNIEWLKVKQFFYWGDVDAQGFHILNQFRSYFPSTIALMMNKQVLSHFEKYIEVGTTTAYHLPNLTKEEAILYEYLRQNNLRLEQEKITNAFVQSEINFAFQNIL